MSTTSGPGVSDLVARLDGYVGTPGPPARLRRVLTGTEAARADAWPLLLPWVGYGSQHNGWADAVLAVAGLHTTAHHGDTVPHQPTASRFNGHEQQAARTLGGLMGLAVRDDQLAESLGEGRIRAMATVPHPTDLAHAIKQTRYLIGRGYVPDWEQLTWDLLALSGPDRNTPDPSTGITRSATTKRRWVAHYWTFAPAPTPAS